MSELGKEIKYFWSQRCFAVGLPLIMLLSYATLLHHPTVGIDDTSFKLYYVDGVSPAMGRFGLYIINKFFPLDYNPYFVEMIGLLFFCLSISLWCIVFYRMFGDKISMLGYTIFGGVMISSPIISEVVIWYLQDGIYLGYGFTALSVLLMMESFRIEFLDRKRTSLRKRCLQIVGGAATLTIALGFYEAFMFVFLMAMVMIFLLIRVLDHKAYSKRPLDWLVNMAAVGILAMVMRSMVINGIVAIFHLESQT
ncbi:MAG: glucosyltransferase domain-containing protein, partial [Lachnospiraceae bacterium]|nr:glucosyltransferase domain-containing protein [Lachnospiraceae bacterium]